MGERVGAAGSGRRKLADAVVLIMALVGLALVARGSFIVLSGPPGTNILGWAYVVQGYVVGGLASEILAATLVALRYRTGMVAVAVASVIMLNLAFLWTSRGPWDTTLVNRSLDPIVLGLVGVGVDTGVGIAVVDVVFLGTLAAAGASTFLLSRRPGWSPLLDSLLATSSLTLLLALEVYAWDRGEFYVHFASLSPPWFTNFGLAVSSSCVLCAAAALRLVLRTGQHRRVS
jgi:hypothetical protein